MKRNLLALDLLLAVLFLVPASFAGEAPRPAPSLAPAAALAAPNVSSPAARALPVPPETMAGILAAPAEVSPLQFQCAQLPPTCCIAWNGHCHYCTAYNCEPQ